MIDKIVESTLQYALPSREVLRPLVILSSRESGDVHLYGRAKGKLVRQLYLDGYHAGTVNAKSWIPSIPERCGRVRFLEEPRKGDVQRSIGRRSGSGYMLILDDVSGSSAAGKEGSERGRDGRSDDDEEDEDGDELIDVAEEDSSDESSVLQDLWLPLRVL